VHPRHFLNTHFLIICKVVAGDVLSEATRWSLVNIHNEGTYNLAHSSLLIRKLCAHLFLFLRF